MGTSESEILREKVSSIEAAQIGKMGLPSTGNPNKGWKLSFVRLNIVFAAIIQISRYLNSKGETK